MKNNKYFFIFFLLFIFFGCNLYASNLNVKKISDKDSIVLYDNFSDTFHVKQRWAPSINYKCLKHDNKNCLFLFTKLNKSNLITADLPIDEIRGTILGLSISLKSSGLTSKKYSYNGIKVGMIIDTQNGEKDYPQIPIDTLAFDWKTMTICIKIPEDATKVRLLLGIEYTKGEVWFGDVLVKKLKKKNAPKLRKISFTQKKYHRTHAYFRGVMVDRFKMNEDDLKNLRNNWKANIIRWPMGGAGKVNSEGLKVANYDSLINVEFGRFDEAVVLCKKYKMNIILDFHNMANKCFSSTQAQSKMIEAWKKIALRYKKENTVVAYDIANEPGPKHIEWTVGLLSYNDLVEKIVETIRAIDLKKNIIIESLNGDPSSFKELIPIDFSIPNIIYSVHLYRPLEFTHQGVYFFESLKYPGMVKGVMWDKQKLIETLKPVKAFQEKYKVPIIVGEFSAIRWAPENSAYNYIKDCIEIFEDYGWDWCYCAYRSYNGWSVEHNDNKNDIKISEKTTQREKLLRKYFSKNK